MISRKFLTSPAAPQAGEEILSLRYKFAYVALHDEDQLPSDATMHIVNQVGCWQSVFFLSKFSRFSRKGNGTKLGRISPHSLLDHTALFRSQLLNTSLSDP